MFMTSILLSYLRQFSFSSLFGKCGKYVNNLLLIVAVIVLMCSFTIPTYAADGTEPIDTIDVDYSGYIANKDTENGLIDVSEDLTVSVHSNLNGAFNKFIFFAFPSSSSSEHRLYVTLSLDEDFDLNSEHEYNLSYEWGYNINLAVAHQVILTFYNPSGEIIKEQVLYEINGSEPYIEHSVNFDFKPDVSDITGGYKCELNIVFVQVGYNSASYSQGFYVSPEINLVDKDDDSGWFQKIINKIEETINYIKQTPERINAKLNELKEGIINAFVVLKENLIDGIKALFIPDDNFFDEKISEMELFLEDHFGIIYTAPNILITIIEKLLSISPGQPAISFPPIEFNFLGQHISLMDKAITLNLYDLVAKGTPLYTLYQFYRAFATAFLIYSFVQYAINKYNYLFGKDGEAVGS